MNSSMSIVCNCCFRSCIVHDAVVAAVVAVVDDGPILLLAFVLLPLLLSC